MKNWPRKKINQVLKLGHDLWYVSRPGIHTYSPSDCGGKENHGMTQGGNRCENCLMNDLQELFRDKRSKRVQS